MNSITKYLVLVFLVWSVSIHGQSESGEYQNIYDVSAESIYPYMLGTAGFYLAGQMVRQNSDGPELEDLITLRRDDIWAFDRKAIDQLSPGIAKFSDYLLYGSFALPVIGYLDKDVRSEGMAMTVMLFEAILITDGITNMIKGSTKRYRPYNYNPEVSLDEKLNGKSRLSFVSGHTSISAAMTFLTASVLTDLHPESKYNKFIWGVAVAIPAITGYCRFRAGRHFPTDIIGGYALGMGMGLLVPRLHKSSSVRVGPTENGLGITFLLK